MLRLPLKSTALSPVAGAETAARPGPAEVAAGALALLVALAMRPRILSDGAAVALRYAERFVQGGGLTYNAGESVLGFAHPLWTLLVALSGLFIGGVELPAQALGIVAFALSAALLLRLGRLLGSEGDGLVAAALAIVHPGFRDAMLAGTGSALTVVLLLAGLELALRRHPIAAGVTFGLAAANDPLALVLPVGLGVASWLQERQLPRRLLDFAGTTWAASLVLLLIGYGHVLPHRREPFAPPVAALAGSDLSPGGFLFARFGYVLLVLAALRLARLERERERERVASLALAIAFALELPARALFGASPALAAELATLLPPLFLLASAAPAALARRDGGLGRPRPLAAVVLLAIVALPALGGLAARAATRGALGAGEAFDFEARAAGRWLDGATEREGPVRTASAWTAFELAADVAGVVPRPDAAAAEQPVYEVAWGASANGVTAPPPAPDGMVPVAIFDAARAEHPELPWITIFAAPASALARSGRRAFTLNDFDAPAPLAAPFGLQHVRFEGRDLFAHPPSGARFRVPNLRRTIEIRFTPAFSPAVPPAGSDGVTFELLAQGRAVYRSHLLPTDRPEPVRLRLVEASSADETELDFVTTPGPAQNAVYDSVYWREVRIDLEPPPSASRLAPDEPAPGLQPPDS